MKPRPPIELSKVIRVHYGAALKEADRDQSGCHQVYGSSGAVGRHSKALFNYPSIIIGRKGSVGAVTYAPSGGWAIDTAFFVEPLDPTACDLRYLFYALNYSRLAKHTITTSIPGLNRNDIYRSRIHFPAPDVQRRIADILDKADAIRRKRKEAIALTDQLLRSAFLEMFGDPVTNPKGWPVKPLGEGIERLESGWSANGDARPRNGEEYGVLKVSAVTSGIFRPEEHKAVPATAVARGLVTPRRGDLLFSRANTRDLVAATCLVERDEPQLFLPDKLWRVVPRADTATAPYLRFLLAHNRFRTELTKTATGTSGSMLNVSMDKLRGLMSPLPPIDRQEEFSELVWGALDARAHNEAAHQACETLFMALFARAFSGSLENPC